jgi:hypothetical protein
MSLHSRRVALFTLLIAIIGMLFFSAGLPALQLLPGQAIPGAEEFLAFDPVDSAPVVGDQTAIPQPVLILTVVIFTLAFIFLIFDLAKKVKIKTILLLLAGLAVVELGVFLLYQLGSSSPQTEVTENVPLGTPQVTHFQTAPLGDPPPNFTIWVIVIVLVVAAALLAYMVFLTLRSRTPQRGLDEPAAAALKALEGGGDLPDVILRCYKEMADCINREHGIERDVSLTPREFEAALVAKDLPAAPVHELTRLFELVRYGDKQADDADRGSAVACLTAIQDSVRKGGKSLK